MKIKLKIRRRSKILCDGKYGKACWNTAVSYCSFCGRRSCKEHTWYVEGKPYCCECYDSLTSPY